MMLIDVLFDILLSSLASPAAVHDIKVIDVSSHSTASLSNERKELVKKVCYFCVCLGRDFHGSSSSSLKSRGVNL